jgi:hypothetical protein
MPAGRGGLSARITWICYDADYDQRLQADTGVLMEIGNESDI